MNYFEINVECMKKHRNPLYKKLQDNNLQDKNKPERIQSLPAKDGELYLTIQKISKEYRLNSSYSPQNEAKKWIEQYSFHNMNIVISLFGFGSGIFAREIKKNKGEGDVVFIYEPSLDVFRHVLHHYDISDILADSSIVLSVEGVNEFEFHSLLQETVNITNYNTQIRCTHPFYENIFPESAIKFWTEIIDSYKHAILNINTERVFGKRYIKNAMYNLKHLKESVRLEDIANYLQKDIPAIIVAAGPSLKENLEQLKRAKGKAYIFVVDRILDYVLDFGIEPDFIVTVDPIKPLKYFTKRTDVEIPLLCELSSNWEVLDQHKGRKVIYSCNPFFQKLYLSLKKIPPIMDTGGSVATTAFSACIQLGFKKIVLVGQDLAYDGDVAHAGGIVEKLSHNTDIYVDGIDGNKVRSRHDWYAFLNWFKDWIILNPEVHVIDAKDRGAKIEGATVMPLNEVIDKYCTSDISPLDISCIERTFSNDEMEDVKKFFSDTYDGFNKLIKKSKEAISICEEQIRIYKNFKETSISEKNYMKISKINKYISQQPSFLLLETFITSASVQQISSLYHFTDDKQQDKISTYQKSITIFQAIIDGAEYAKPKLKDSIQCL